MNLSGGLKSYYLSWFVPHLRNLIPALWMFVEQVHLSCASCPLTTRMEFYKLNNCTYPIHGTRVMHWHVALLATYHSIIEQSSLYFLVSTTFSYFYYSIIQHFILTVNSLSVYSDKSTMAARSTCNVWDYGIPKTWMPFWVHGRHDLKGWPRLWEKLHRRSPSPVSTCTVGPQ